jgi:hypothetical protein|tara:strand:- start:1461 stop:1589 length:129 start_codon:yes stop_codon:yes gene_type:complete
MAPGLTRMDCSFEIDRYGDAEVQMAEEIADLVGDILTQSRDM